MSFFWNLSPLVWDLAEHRLPVRSAQPIHSSQAEQLRAVTLRKAWKERTRSCTFLAVALRLWNNRLPKIHLAPFLGNFE